GNDPRHRAEDGRHVPRLRGACAHGALERTDGDGGNRGVRPRDHGRGPRAGRRDGTRGDDDRRRRRQHRRGRGGWPGGQNDPRVDGRRRVPRVPGGEDAAGRRRARSGGRIVSAGARAGRTPVIAGNWKMNRGPAATREYFRRFKARWTPRPDRTVLFFPPAVSLTTAADMLRDRPDLGLGAQNIHWQAMAAFTGEVSAPMVKEGVARFVLTGTSERRHLFGESEEQVARKTAAALEADVTPVVCVGETLEERQAGRVEAVILRQLDAVLDALPDGAAAQLMIAYEPVWAIGTGVNASPQDASAAHAILRRRLAERAGGPAAAAIPILYGGSVKPDNAEALLAAP